MDLLYLLHSVLRKKWIIIFSTIVGIAAGVAFALTIKKTYTALAQYSTGFTMGQKVKIKSEETFNIFEIDFQFKNVIETFKSPVVLAMVSYKLMLHDLESDQPYRVLTPEQKKTSHYTAVDQAKLRNTLKNKIALMEELKTHDPEEKKMSDFIALYGYDQQSLMKRFLIERVTGTDYLNIWYRSENPELSAFVANDIGDEFQQFFLKIYSTRTTESSAKLDSLIKQKKAELDDMNKRYEAFKAKIGTPDLSASSEGAMKMLQDATSNFNTELAKLNNYTSSLTAVESQLKTLNASLPTSSSGNQAEIARLRNENNDLAAQDPTGKDPQVQAKIQDNYKKIASLTPSQSNATRVQKMLDQRDELLKEKSKLEADIISTQKNVNLWKTSMNQYGAMANKGGGETVIASTFESDIKRLDDQYNNLLRGQQSAQDVSIAPEINFKQTMIAQPPITPDNSNKKLIVAGAGIAMFAISTLLIILLDLVDSSLKTPSVFLRNTRLKLLGPMNHVDLKRKQVATLFDVNAEKRKNEDLLFVENTRKLRYEIEQTGKKIFLFTSNKIGEGKTTVMEALANSFSLSRRKILLIDSNFSNNSLTQKFEAKPTLESFSVNGEKNPNEKFQEIKTETAIPYVEVVGCNYGNYTPSEILPKSGLLDNIRVIADNYDFVFIEGAALNTHADSKELAKYVDGIISVFSARSVLRQTDKESIQFLRHTGNKYVGAVLNEVQAENIDL
jgi:succinoglycan biosynthesis transport protein ExoP